MARHVIAVCPVCQWESPPAEVDLRTVNGEWHARMEAAAVYWEHFTRHRPAPVFLTRGEDDEMRGEDPTA
jgi:hypothetical protein